MSEATRHRRYNFPQIVEGKYKFRFFNWLNFFFYIEHKLQKQNEIIITKDNNNKKTQSIRRNITRTLLYALNYPYSILWPFFAVCSVGWYSFFFERFFFSRDTVFRHFDFFLFNLLDNTKLLKFWMKNYFRELQWIEK